MCKYFFLILFITFIMVFPAHAAGWVQMEKGTIQGLQGITKAGSSYFAVGNGSNILRSTDSGSSWSIFDQSGSVYWQDVAVNGQKIWVVGEGGAMRESTNAGFTWSQRKLEITDTLYDIDVSAQYGYAVGVNGRILYYGLNTDTWHSATSPTNLPLYGVQDRGDATAWIVGSEGILLYTSDSGITWTNKGKVADTDLNAVWFSSANSGYVVGKNGTIRKTTDKGVSWTTISVSGLSTQTLYDIEVVGDDIVIAGDKVIVRSQDGGATWSVVDYTTENYRFVDVYYPAAEEVWVSGTKDDVQSVILKYEGDSSAPATPQNDSNSVIPSEPSSSVIPSDSEGSKEATPNSLIKLACASGAGVNDPCRAVYFYGSDGKRHAFPNDKVFFTWYENFNFVKEVSQTFLSSLSLGKNVTYHPGTKMVKFQSVTTVYAVSKTGMLRAIGSEQAAKDLYGMDWNKQIDDISDAFFGNYTFGTKIEKATDYDVAAEKTSVSSLDENL
jgi:photosystem II stability/assembly factor-like uncharacterized protein